MRHRQSATCLESGEQQQQHIGRADSVRAQRREFTIRGDTLKQAQSFKYLGRWMGNDDHGGHAVQAQLLKARKVWARL